MSSSPGPYNGLCILQESLVNMALGRIDWQDQLMLSDPKDQVHLQSNELLPRVLKHHWTFATFDRCTHTAA